MNEKAAYTPFRDTTVTNTPTTVRAAPALLVGYNIINRHTSDITVKFYDLLAGDTTVGTSAVTLSILVPASSGSAGTAVLQGDTRGVLFDTAMTVAAVTETADSGTTAPGSLPIIQLFID